MVRDTDVNVNGLDETREAELRKAVITRGEEMASNVSGSMRFDCDPSVPGCHLAVDGAASVGHNLGVSNTPGTTPRELLFKVGREALKDVGLEYLPG